jgi:hypothetical protein
MTKFDGKYSKIILIVLGVLVAIVIGFHSNAVSLDSKIHINTSLIEKSSNIAQFLEKGNNLQSKLLSLLVN